MKLKAGRLKRLVPFLSAAITFAALSSLVVVAQESGNPSADGSSAEVRAAGSEQLEELGITL